MGEAAAKTYLDSNGEMACGSAHPRRRALKPLLSIAGALLLLVGGVWFLQGINVLPGSFMTGQIEWAIYGGLAVVIGIGLLVYANRRRPG